MQNEFFEKVGQILEKARSNAKTAVNLSMVYAYYEIGKNIIEEDLKTVENKKSEQEKYLEQLNSEKESAFAIIEENEKILIYF